MAVLKCKMCGGDLEIQEGVTVAECEYCGTRQTVPTADDEKKLTLFGRANRLRLACEFDKAAGVYEAIVADFPDEAEAYWGLVLCKYGIEYVDDPATAKKIPTCHRSSFDSVMDDADFEQVMENADMAARSVYREEAKCIEELRRGIVEVSSSEEPYDIFICYKETDANGNRTVDSEIAQDVYTALTERGYRVFFARISLEDKLGQAYEPYIFAALNSAKIMLVFGTDYEYFNAVWVKNEWSRFLQLIAKGESKTLIPCYKGVDAYDIPKEFAKLQAQDMGKVGAQQDLLRGIEKILPRAVQTQTVVQQAAPASNATVDSLLQRAFMFLEDRDWKSADEYCEKVLDIDPENAKAYLGKLMVELQVSKQENLKYCDEPFSNRSNYQKVIRFADGGLKKQVEEYNKVVEEHYEQRQATFLNKKGSLKRLVVQIGVGCIVTLLFILVLNLLSQNEESSEAQPPSETTGLSGALNDIQIGDYITFGVYEQDNDTSNGQEDIEWQVLDIQNGKVLVVSKYALDSKPYNAEYARPNVTDVTWETCSLRTWLNTDFIRMAFSEKEKAMIPTVKVTADKNPVFDTNPGNDTQDRVFLLSSNEANQYFDSDGARGCQPTDYAVANGVPKYYNGNCYWWLRSPGNTKGVIAVVEYNGHNSVGGSSAHLDDYAIRPALWIELPQ